MVWEICSNLPKNHNKRTRTKSSWLDFLWIRLHIQGFGKIKCIFFRKRCARYEKKLYFRYFFLQNIALLEKKTSYVPVWLLIINIFWRKLTLFWHRRHIFALLWHQNWRVDNNYDGCHCTIVNLTKNSETKIGNNLLMLQENLIKDYYRVSHSKLGKVNWLWWGHV